MIKQKVQNHYMNLVDSRITLLQKKLSELKESAKNETKSTAGDKHETALAQLQIEQKQIQSQFQEVQQQKAALDSLAVLKTTDLINAGNLIKTNKGYFYLSIALGKIEIENKIIIALSPISPLGAQFLGKKVGDSVYWNGIDYHIEEIS